MTDRPFRPLRRGVVVAIGLVAVITLFVAGYSGAFANPRPHAVPVAAPAALIRQLGIVINIAS